MVKLYLCNEANPDVWRQVQLAGLELLTRCELEWYCELIPNEEDCQDEWDAAVDDPGKYVSLLVGQINDEEQRSERDEENSHDDSAWEQTTQNYFLVYHEVKAHIQWLKSMPAEAEAYKRFQEGKCACIVYV